MRISSVTTAVVAILWSTGALAEGNGQASPLPQIVLAAQDLRPAVTLDGEWTWSVDPFRDGLAGFHGDEAGTGHRRYDDVDVEAVSQSNPIALYEYDMDRSATMTLPGSWIGATPELRYYRGLMWYQKRFDAPATPAARHILHFGAVDYAARVFLNGREVCRHEGGYTPFACEVTGLLRSANNRLTVGVESERTNRSVPPPVTDWEDYGGITRSVRLLSLPETYVDDAWVRLNAKGQIAVDVTLNGKARAGQSITLTIAALGLRAQGSTDANGQLRLQIPAPRSLKRWTPQAPALYDVEIVSKDDRWRDRIGFRTVAVKGAQILLNGEPLFLRGISLHEEEIGANPVRAMTPDRARALLATVRDGLNGNFVRLAHYPHSAVMTRMADEMGLIVWSEVPVYWRVAFADAGTLANARAQLAENILRDRNRASILLWSVANETPISDARNAFLRQLIADVRALDPHRLVTAALLTRRDETASGPKMVLDDPLAPALDVMAVNTYNGWYGPDLPAAVPGIAWDTPLDRPLILSEFGADAKFGFRDAANIRKFTEDYQADYYRATLAMADRIPNLAGVSPWILKDFRSPRRQRPAIQDGWNRKGLISETGERKAAFDVLARWFAGRAKQDAR